MKPPFAFCLPVLPVILAALPSLAADPQPPFATPAAAACQSCHGKNGVSAGGAPNIAGQKADYLAGQLMAFKSGERKNDLMAAVAGQLSAADIQAISAYWSAQPASGPAVPAVIASRMPFPADFPANYTLYETVAGDGAVTIRYANDVALKAARAGQTLPNGSIIVVENRSAEKDGSGAIKPGAVGSYTAMESRAGWGADIPAILRNGDWDYALFGADKTRRVTLNEAQCLACHKPAAADSYVFTMKALRSKASG